MAFIRKNNIKEAALANSPDTFITAFSTNEDILNGVVRNIRTQIDEVLNENLFKINNEKTREIVKQKVTEILHGAKERCRTEGKCFEIDGQLVPAVLLNPTVEVVYQPMDYSVLVCQFNRDAQLLVDEMYDTNYTMYDAGDVTYLDKDDYMQGTIEHKNIKYKL